MRKVVLSFVVLFALSVAPASAKDIIDVAEDAGIFKTLLTAVDAADLEDALESDGPFTVFAPTDDAFAALPAGTVENLLKKENKKQLVAVLSYHVVPRKLTANMLPHNSIHVRTIKRSGDRTLAVKKSRGGVRVDGARVVKADVMAENGVIHVIDKVMLPSR